MPRDSGRPACRPKSETQSQNFVRDAFSLQIRADIATIRHIQHRNLYIDAWRILIGF